MYFLQSINRNKRVIKLNTYVFAFPAATEDCFIGDILDINRIHDFTYVFLNFSIHSCFYWLNKNNTKIVN